MKRTTKTLLTLLCLTILIAITGCNQSNTNTDNREYGFAMARGNGYNLVATLRGGENGFDVVGVIDDNGNWIQPLSENHPFIEGNATQGHTLKSA